MTTLNHQIIEKISKITFSDGSSAESRASSLIIKNNNVGFSLNIESIPLNEAESVRLQISQAIAKIPNIDNITIILTRENQNVSKDPKQNTPIEKKTKIVVDNVKEIIVIAAGKGGVGKSTIAALIAHTLKNRGAKVGIVDADIYGPSIPNIFGLKSHKPTLEDNKMVPFIKYGIEINSIGFVIPEAQSVTMRGPMTSKALYQLISLTKWGQLDYLIIDTPGGTGDIHISLLQNYLIDRAIIVTTPQKVAAIDVERTINLYQKFNIPITGIIENMSYLIDPISQKQHAIFSGNSGEKISNKFDIPLIAKIPITLNLSESCDTGEDLSKFTSLLDKVT